MNPLIALSHTRKRQKTAAQALYIWQRQRARGEGNARGDALRQAHVTSSILMVMISSGGDTAYRDSILDCVRGMSNRIGHSVGHTHYPSIVARVIANSADLLRSFSLKNAGM